MPNQINYIQGGPVVHAAYVRWITDARPGESRGVTPFVAGYNAAKAETEELLRKVYNYLEREENFATGNFESFDAGAAHRELLRLMMDVAERLPPADSQQQTCNT